MNGMMSKEMIMAYLLRAVVMLVAIPVHEAAHAWASWKLGDDTARRAGRMSLNPMAHFDPMGAVCMIFVGVGWAKPVGINPYRFRRPKQGMALSAAAGPASNLVLAFFSLIAYKFHIGNTQIFAVFTCRNDVGVINFNRLFQSCVGVG